ncbi:MAG: choice-of-anchor J domain-containing protein [Flavobacteriales bacterium]|nr:choice-of-anchor J domain-containing protein [Flavobacteriales bacterium]MCB9203395.1 choice-of-anchor J domain-containing protein [Flavobacteriales bacterium]
MKKLLPAFFLMLTMSGFAQNMYRPSDHEISRSPEWAQMMYAENPNVFEVDKAFKAYFEEHDFEKSYHTQYYKRWRRSVDAHVNRNGFVEMPTEQDFLREREDMLINSGGTRAGNWSLVGPMVAYNTGGNPVSQQSNIYAIDQAPSNPNVLYCGSETGEAYRSDDGGNNWTNISLNDALNGAVRSIDIHPTDPNTVYIGSGSYIYKSTDGGSNWTDVLYTWQLNANEILINPTNPNIVLAATNKGVFRTINGGSSWDQLYTQRAFDLKHNTANSNIVYLLKHDDALDLCLFLRSTDAGATFTPQMSGWYSSTDPDRNDGGGRLAVSDADPNRVYAYLIGEAKAGDTGYIGVWKSTDGGLNWTLPNGPAGGPYDANHMNLAIGTVNWQYHQGYYNCALMASNTNPDQIRLGGLNLYGSDDGGATFYALAGYVGGPYSMHVDMQDFRAIGNTTWITTDGGIYRSTDFFNTNGFESRMYGIHSSDYWGFGSGWNEDVLIGGLYHNGNLSFHENYGYGNFLQLGGGEPASGYVNQGENRRVYSSDINGKIMPESIGDPVQNVGFGIDPNERYWAVESSELEFDPRCYSIAYTGKDHQLWRTDDKGATFTLFAEFGSDADNRITYIEQSWSDPDVMYVCQQNVNPSSSGTLWKTTDGGQNWNSLTLPSVSNSRKMLLQVDPTDHNNVWIAFESTGNGQRVYKSENGGQSWTNLTTSTLDGESPRSLNLIGGTDGGVYLSTNKTIFYRNNSMNDWVDFGDGLPIIIKSNIARPFYRDGKMRIASYGKGIWESRFYEDPSVPIAQVMVDKFETTQHCEEDTFHYVCHSMLNHTNATWEWTFQGGTPSTANTWYANVVYDTPGTHLTILKVTDGDGDFSIDSLYITVNAYQPLATLNEGFETVFPPNGFEIKNADENITWELKDDVGGYGNSDQCMFIRGYDYTAVGQDDDAVVSIDMTYLQDAWLTFDVAYARWGGGYSDTLEILVSTDCGATMQSLYFKGGTDLATSPDFQDGWFIPTDQQWRTDSVDLSAYYGNEDVMITFRHHCGWGQNTYIDNINLVATNVVGVQETEEEPILTVYPNPVSGDGNLHLYSNLNEPIQVEMYSMDGKRIYRETHPSESDVNMPELSAGSYLYVLTTSKLIKKGVFVVQ